ncbi:bacteriocin [Mucilaginibacter ginkgonis]|uniref:Bacteriocin n=1 Tax=Mucilaginibacter ginkgonis TaxID=2682091 RepID=A0A6I4HUE5_9SPHI|nr:bacteriocin [Mucilaginibacter ginkgonis]QQL50459.1 bacteriocin [Mucilaginibacter ginkgonis]
MKMQELNEQELKAVNGGSLFGGNDSSSQNAFGGALSIGNLLSTSNSSQDGDESNSSSTSVGNGISLDLAGIFNKVTS